MYAGGYKRKLGDIYHELGASESAMRLKPLEVDGAGVSGIPGHDQLGWHSLASRSISGNRSVRLAVNVIMHEVISLAGERYRRTVGQCPRGKDPWPSPCPRN